MTNTEIARAYDAIAAGYDRQLEGDQWMRDVLWRHYLRRFRPGQRLLDVSCGSGLDSCFLASSGMLVTGIDISPGMIGEFRQKAARLGLLDRLDIHVLDLAGLASWPPQSFDGIISAFAGLNTSPDLSGFSRDAARLLRPGGRMVLHMLNRFSLWEWLGLVRDRRYSEARRLRSQRERYFVVGDQRLRHYLLHPREAYARFFAREFLLEECYSLGSLRPPHTVRRIPSPVARALGSLEQPLAAHRPLLDCGRFFVLDMVPRQEAQP
jgi:SAM-dependent methyltransferase